jgi:hypothetical protein
MNYPDSYRDEYTNYEKTNSANSIRVISEIRGLGYLYPDNYRDNSFPFVNYYD